MKEEISVVVACKPMWQNMRVNQTVTNSPYAHINIQLLLVSRMDYTSVSQTFLKWGPLL
jgi:hypothetical protein